MSKQTFYATTLGFNLPLSKWLKAINRNHERHFPRETKKKKKIQKIGPHN
jgi:hypothetical protein